MPYSGPTSRHRHESGATLPLLVWRFAEPLYAIASGPFGGGIGERGWVLNATVDKDYARLDPDVHIVELAATAGLTGPGVGLLTAVDVLTATTAEDDGVVVTATVGLGYLTMAAAPPGPAGRVGTINLVVLLPVRLSAAALVNAVATATEAKVQALWECGVKATGTATDALFVGSATAGPAEPYGGPRSTWGARIARAVFSAVTEGTRQWTERTSPGRTSPL